MKQTAKALVYLLALALSLAPVLLLVTLPLLLVTQARKLIQHEEKNKKTSQHCKTVLVTGAPHTKVNNECCHVSELLFLRYLFSQLCSLYHFETMRNNITHS